VGQILPRNLGLLLVVAAAIFLYSNKTINQPCKVLSGPMVFINMKLRCATKPVFGLWNDYEWVKFYPGIWDCCCSSRSSLPVFQQDYLRSSIQPCEVLSSRMIFINMKLRYATKPVFVLWKAYEWVKFYSGI